MPWEVEHIPDNWIYAIEGFALRLPGLQRGMNEVETIKAKWRQNYKQRYKH